MRILVAVKRVIDFNIKARPKADRSGVDLDNVKMALNPFCEIAIEEAVRLKEQGLAEEVIAISVGSKACSEQLRTALALGADRAILVDTADSETEPLAIAKILAKVAESEKPDAIILGKQSIDGDNNQTGQMLAALLGWPQGTFVSELKFEDGKVGVTREIDGGLQSIELDLPAILTTDLRLNEPRYASLPNIMKARSKPLAELPVSELGLDLTPRQKILQVTPPPEREAGIMVESVEELVDKLRNEAKAIS
ncbi:MAG: electron transfer flavoprotein subunit beta/FixA family protein [Gammaproteobacteria bacterium]